MKGCRRCGSSTLAVVRESVTRRGRHEYAMCWYRCPQCNEVSLSYRLLHELPHPDAASALFPAEEVGEPALSPAEPDPVLSR